MQYLSTQQSMFQKLLVYLGMFLDHCIYFVVTLKSDIQTNKQEDSIDRGDVLRFGSYKSTTKTPMKESEREYLWGAKPSGSFLKFWSKLFCGIELLLFGNTAPCNAPIPF